MVEFEIINLINTEVISRGKIKFSPLYRNYNLLNLLLDDSARLFIGIVTNARYIEDIKYKLFACTYDEAEDLVEVDLFSHLVPFQMSFSIDKTNTIIGVGLCLEEINLRDIKGYFCLRISNTTLQIISKDIKTLEDKLEMQFVGSEESYLYQVNCSLKLRDVSILSDSTLMVSSEMYYGGYEAKGNLDKIVYFYGDILNATISKAGKITHLNVLTKYQVAHDESFKLGYLVTKPGKQLNFVFIDNINNYDENNNQTGSHRMELNRNAVPVSATIRSDGQVKYNVLREFSGSGVIPMVQYSFCISNDKKEYILFSQKLKDFKFIKLYYE